MAIRVIMPALEVAQETGKLVSWLKNEGDNVHKGELLLEIETDKAVMEVEAEADGRIPAAFGRVSSSSTAFSLNRATPSSASAAAVCCPITGSSPKPKYPAKLARNFNRASSWFTAAWPRMSVPFLRWSLRSTC